ncbi:lipopolysaccharide core heptose(II) kinase RfaY [Fulvivirga imtechensis]|uniref:lipopolysaccharide core heptose(II) kinase RfaY n=1 Tax=Fulvivirga imtechensis TaxID=881893 RepID=UPI0012F827AB|nr:lipopolysaccharide core heptose(II) kinase RfaY [Fulvivirga imtechensis]
MSKSQNISLFDMISEGQYTIKSPLKEHHRSDVYKIEINKQEYVLKTPKEKNKKWWIRFTTLFRDGEAFKNIKGMFKYEELGLHTTKPVMAAEKRKLGMVTDSWLLYEFLDGESCLDREEFYPMVVKELKLIHSKGYLHGDPQIRNFLHRSSQIYVIDSNPKRVGVTGFSRAYEFAYLRKSAPGIEAYFGEINNWRLYKLAFKYDIYERKFVRTRRKIKKLFLFKN